MDALRIFSWPHSESAWMLCTNVCCGQLTLRRQALPPVVVEQVVDREAKKVEMQSVRPGINAFTRCQSGLVAMLPVCIQTR